MPIIKYKDIVESALNMPVFSSSYLIKKGMPRNYVKVLLHRLASKKRIYKVKKGLYATIDDPIAVAGNITFPSYISMYTALYIRGALYQVPTIIQVVTTRRKKNKKINFLGTTIEFHRIKKELFFGFEYIQYNDFEIPVANVEKAIIDLFYFKGGLIGTIEIDSINRDKLMEYLKIIDKKSLKRKILRWLKNGFTNQ